jgi:diguanylate cyclase (GGDEF)-like protein/PAS domain S-box-containing protein
MIGKNRKAFNFYSRSPSPADVPVGAPHSLSLRHLWWAAILLLGVSASAVALTIFQLREDAIRAAVSESGSIASVLASQLSRSVQSIDVALLEIKQAAEADSNGPSVNFGREFDRVEFMQYLKRSLSRTQQVFSLAMADKDGRVIVSTLSGINSNFYVSDRDYFREARDRADGGISVSIPAANRVTGTRTVAFARRLDDSKGAFAGIVFASVDAKYFENIYSAIQSVHSLLFTLLNPDGVILLRHPDDGDSAGLELSNKAQWSEALAKGSPVLRLRGKADDTVRYVSIRRVPHYPLIVDVSLSEGTVLDTWQRRAATMVAGSSVLLILSLYLLGAITRQVGSLGSSQVSLAEKSQQLDAALNNMSQGLTMYDAQGHLIVSNSEFQKISGLTAEQLKPGTSLANIIQARIAAGTAPEKAPTLFVRSFKKALQTGSSRTILTLHDGRTVSVIRQMMDTGGWVSIHQDITEQKRIEAQLARMASYDGLTGLANRALLIEKISEALGRSCRNGEEFSLLMLDLDRFKTVNDSLGHPAGDSLLKEIARRLKKATREIDCVARLGGDEFAVLQAAEPDQRPGAVALSNRILHEIRQPFDLDGRTLNVGTSIGIAIASQHGDDADALIKHADLALYQAKAEGRDRFCFFEPEMEAHARECRELEDDLRRAIDRQEFELHYQTIFDLENYRCAAVEALVRWRDPERGLIHPDQFISFAEESSLIVPLGRWILHQACADAVKWPPQFKVCVNLSPVQFRNEDDLLNVIKSALAETGLPAERLALEITETVLLENNEANLALLHELKQLGISIVLDDFGIGYSSMTYLQTFPFDGIKIDQSFTQTMAGHSGAAIVCAIAGLGRSLDMATTAEGAETVDQLTFLRAAGCQYAQGYLLSRPVPASELVFEFPDALLRDPAAA